MTLHEATRHPERDALIDILIEHAGHRANEMLSAPGDPAAKLRQTGDDGLNPIQHLEASPAAVDQLVAVALRLTGSRTMRGDASDHLATFFRTSSSSLEIEATRRSVWQANRTLPAPVDDAVAVAAVAKIEREAAGRNEADLSEELAEWAALYADLWCDPRLGADADARRVMLEMVSCLHDRSRALAAARLEKSDTSAVHPSA